MPQQHFGSEPPGPGWIAAGPSRWLRTDGSWPRIAVIGGGPGGLFISWMLNDVIPDAALTIFEATGRLGGKIRTKRFRDGTPYEHGVAELYEYLGPGGKDPLRLLIEEELGLRTVNISGGGVILGEHVLRDLDDFEAAFGAEARRHVERFRKLCADLMPLDKYANRWQPDNSHPWAQPSFLECLHREVTNDDALAYIKAAIHSDLATEPHTCNGLNGIKNVLMDDDRYMQVYHVVGGIEKVARRLAEGVEADVRLSATVVSVTKVASAYRVAFLSNGREQAQEFDAVVCAIPNHWLTQIRWDGKLAEAMHSIVAHYDLPAHYLRATMLFKSAWWKRHGMPGEFWMWDGFNGCCVYDESTRWRSKKGHVLSFLIAGQDALLMCSQDQSNRCILRAVLDRLPSVMAADAEREYVDGTVSRYVGSINAQPGGWPVEELRGEHQPEPADHPGVFIVGDYLFDSTLNAALISAATALDLVCEHFGIPLESESEVVEVLAPGEPL